MSALKIERVESKFINFEFFWKDAENSKNDANTSKIYFLDFLLFFAICFV
jgi:hypothetical protein